MILVVLCCVINASAQKKNGLGAAPAKGAKNRPALGNVRLSWGDTFKIPNHFTSMALLGTQDKGVVEIFNREMKSMLMKRRDGKFRRPAVKEISLDLLPPASTSEIFITLKGRTFWLYSNWEKESAVERVYAREMDLEHLALSEQTTLLQFQDKISPFEKPMIQEDPRIIWTQMSGYNSRKYQFSLSPDSTRLIIKYTLKSKAENADKWPELVGLNLFDENLKFIKSSLYAMPYAKELMQIVDYQLDANDEPCFLVKVFDIPKSDSGLEGKCHFEVFRFAGESKKPDILTIAKNDKYTQDIRLCKDAKGEIVCAGIYSTSETGVEDGIYLTKLDLKTNVFIPYRKGAYSFPAEQNKGVAVPHTPAAKKAKVNLPEPVKAGLRFKDIRFHADGSITIACEEQGITESPAELKKVKSESAGVYHYRNIVVMKIDSGGDMVWYKKLPKSQSGNEKPGEMSFDLMTRGNELLLLYMDDPKNKKLRPNQAQSPFSDGTGGELVFLQIDSKGKETKGILFDSKMYNQMVFPTKFKHISPTRILGEALGKGTETSFFIDIN